MSDEVESAITAAEITVGDDGLGYYTGQYANGELGPRSEGYGHAGQSEQEALRAAETAVKRDFPWLEDSDLHLDVGT
jgi:hypothetical protein